MYIMEMTMTIDFLIFLMHILIWLQMQQSGGYLNPFYFSDWNIILIKIEWLGLRQSFPVILLIPFLFYNTQTVH